MTVLCLITIKWQEKKLSMTKIFNFLFLITLIDFLTKFALEEIANKLKKHVMHSLTKEKWKGIMNLRKDKEIMIKESDKCGACVIVHKKISTAKR